MTRGGWSPRRWRHCWCALFVDGNYETRMRTEMDLGGRGNKSDSEKDGGEEGRRRGERWRWVSWVLLIEPQRVEDRSVSKPGPHTCALPSCSKIQGSFQCECKRETH